MIEDFLEESVALGNALINDATLPKKFREVVDHSLMAFRDGKKILAAGNGGSAADAQHFAAEFTGKYKRKRKPLPAIALTTDTSFLTAWSNDEEFDGVFARQIEALGEEGDIFFAISTSGASQNILLALEVAKRKGLYTVALLGGSGGAARGLADIEFIVPSGNTPRIQEAHTLLLHGIAEEVEKAAT